MGQFRQWRNRPSEHVDPRAEKLQELLGSLCVELGFCNRLTAQDVYALDDGAFARKVMEAEGMEPFGGSGCLSVIAARHRAEIPRLGEPD